MYVCSVIGDFWIVMYVYMHVHSTFHYIRTGYFPDTTDIPKSFIGIHVVVSVVVIVVVLCMRVHSPRRLPKGESLINWSFVSKTEQSRQK